MPKITDPDLLEDSIIDDASQEVFIDTSAKQIKLNVVGNLSNTGVQNDNGVSLKALYSFLKEEWKNDPLSKNLAAFPFPMVPITDESFEWVDGWDLFDDSARYLIRDAGWTVKNTSGLTTQQWAGIIGLGTIEPNDQLYYQQVAAGSTINVQLTGQVNQAVQIVKDDDGDGNYAELSDFDRRSFFKLFVREQGQTYAQAQLTDIGVTSLSAQAYRFPISTGTDLKITESDVNIAANAPYTQINVKYFDQNYQRDVDSVGTNRNFGVVIDVGTHSGVDGSFTSGLSVLSTAEAGIIGANYTGGTLTIHEGAAKGVYSISGTPTAGSITITGTFPATQAAASFTLQRATPVSASAKQIYEKVQYLLRQNIDINSTDQIITGKTADLLLKFVGDTLESGTFNPSNPNGGGSGVIIEGFQTSDTNSLVFRDNTAANRTYPFVAVITINFGDNLKNDVTAKYWVYFTTLPGAGNDFGESGALLVDDASGVDITGNVSAAASVQKTFNYDNNVQGGRTPGTDATITAIGIGLQTGQYVRATGTIERSTANSISLVAALERNYST
jgi:hypothetical protein